MQRHRTIEEICSRIDHLENAAEWIARETVHTDNGISQTGTLIVALAAEIRQRLTEIYEIIEGTSQFH